VTTAGLSRCLVDEGIIIRAKLIPSLSRFDPRRYIRDILSKNNREASVQVPIDVAVEEPRARVVGKEPNCDLITSGTNTHDIPDNRFDKVVGRVTSAADHVEVVPVQMDRMRYIKDTSRNGQFNTLESIETVDAACRNHPTHSLHRSGFGATRGQLGVQS